MTDRVCQAGRYQRHPDRQDTRAGSYQRKLATKVGEVSLKVPRLGAATAEAAPGDRHH